MQPSQTPFTLVTAHAEPECLLKSDLRRLCRELEAEALAEPPARAAASLQDVRHLSPRTRAVYTELAARGTDVVLLARDLQSWIAPGVRGVALDDDDPLVDVWSLVQLGPTRAVALAAVDLHTPGVVEDDRRFAAAVSRDRDVVVASLRALESVVPVGGG